MSLTNLAKRVYIPPPIIIFELSRKIVKSVKHTGIIRRLGGHGLDRLVIFRHWSV